MNRTVVPISAFRFVSKILLVSSNESPSFRELNGRYKLSGEAKKLST